MEQDTIEGRVKRGVELLDKVLPGWRKKIDQRKLDIKNTDDCILGQVSGGDFFEGLQLVGLLNNVSHNYGFNAYSRIGQTVEEVDDEFIALNATWHSVLSGNNN